jgi:hypothetical protein
MRRITPVNKMIIGLSWLIAIILVLLPFHAFLTVWFSSFLGHYTALRLWKEFLLVPIVLGALYLLWKNPAQRRRIFSLWPARLIAIYALLLLVCASVARANGAVGTKALWYGLLVDLRFLVFFLAVLIIAASSSWLGDRWRRILLAPAIVVAVFAILQYLVLPYDFLKHFGYSNATISPYETINHNLQRIRVASTLRGANPLGAYLILPILVLAIAYIKEKSQRRNIAIFGTGLLLALAFSFSRSAWIGVLFGLIIITWLSIKNTRLKKNLLLGLAAVILIVAALTVLLRNNTGFESIVYHTDHTSKIAQSSNEGHSAAFKAAGRDILHEPLGRGVGTAGPASTYNYRHNGRISENYFMQIGQEAGWLGMLLFIAICISIGKMLYVRRSDPLALALFASLIGIAFVNLLSHAWTDDTLAYIWWGLAAVACAPLRPVRQNT